MTRLTPRNVSTMSDKERALFELMADGRELSPEGYIGGPFDGWSLNPSTGRRIWQLGGSLRWKPTIDRRYVELAILMTGQQWQAQFEWFAHEPMARDAGLPEEVIQAVKHGEEPTFTDKGDELCWRFCRLLLDRQKIDDTTYQATVDHFGEPGVSDLINACGFYTLVSMTLNTFEVDLPEGAEPPFSPQAD